jgi:phospholipid N-methyltransferase
MLNVIIPAPRKARDKMPDDTLRLLRQFLKSPQSVGTVLPSSRELVEEILAPIDFNATSTLVEYGPGSGALTAIIAERLPTTARYIGIEINREFYLQLSARFPQLQFVNQNASDVRSILKSRDIEGVDAIVCGLPWASLPSAQQPAILDSTTACLSSGGIFVTYAYLQGLLLPGAWSLRRRLKHRFAQVGTTRIVWNNVPPAFAYICRR